MPTMVEPILDRCQMSVRSPGVVTFSTAQLLRSALEAKSMKVMSNYPASRRIKAERTTPVIVSRQANRNTFNMATDLNSIVWFREKYESGRKPPKGLDGNTNLFCDRRWYGRASHVLNQQVDHLETIVATSRSKMIDSFECSGLNPPSTFALFVRQLEMTWHTIVAAEEANLRLRLLYEEGLKRYQVRAFFEPHNHKIALKGVRFLFHDGMFLRIYRKQTDLLRFEVVWEDLFFRTYEHRDLLKDANNLRTLLRQLANSAWTYVEPFFRLDPSAICELPAVDAMSAFMASCSRSTLNEILTRLLEGDGRMCVASNENAVYRNVRDLVAAGILKPGVMRGEYYLAPEYRAVLQNAAIFNRALAAVDYANSTLSSPT